MMIPSIEDTKTAMQLALVGQLYIMQFAVCAGQFVVHGVMRDVARVLYMRDAVTKGVVYA